MNHWSDVDPLGTYPSECPRRVEHLARRLMGILPGAQLSRTRDVIQLDAGGDEGIVIVVTPEAVELRLPTIEWTCGSHGPAASSRLWRRVKSASLDDERLEALIAAAQRARQREYRRCRYCGERVPPEHQFEDNVCHGCAQQHLQVVF